MWAILFSSHCQSEALVSFHYACRFGQTRARSRLIGAPKNIRDRSLFILFIHLITYHRVQYANAGIGAFTTPAAPDKRTRFGAMKNGGSEHGKLRHFKISNFSPRILPFVCAVSIKSHGFCVCRCRRRRHHVSIISIFSHHCISPIHARYALPKFERVFVRLNGDDDGEASHKVFKRYNIKKICEVNDAFE